MPSKPRPKLQAIAPQHTNRAARRGEASILPPRAGIASSVGEPTARAKTTRVDRARPLSSTPTSPLSSAGVRIGTTSSSSSLTSVPVGTGAVSVVMPPTTTAATVHTVMSTPLGTEVLDTLLKPSFPPSHAPLSAVTNGSVTPTTRVSSSRTYACDDPVTSVVARTASAKLPDIIVVDTDNHRVLLFCTSAGVDAEGAVLAGGNGEGDGLHQLNTPCDVAVDSSDGSLLITDAANDRVVRWVQGAKAGIVVAGGNGCGQRLDQLDCPSGIAMSADGSLFIADCGNHRVLCCPRGAPCGRLLAGRTGQPGEGLDQLSSPNGLSLGSDGSVFVADTDNNRVIRFRVGVSKGEVVAGGRGEGDDPSQVGFPTGVAVTRTGAIVVSERYRQASTYRVTQWMCGDARGVALAYGGLDELNMPWGILEAPCGGLLIVDAGHYCVLYWPPGAREGQRVAGGRRGSALNQMKNPCGIALA